MLNSWLVIVIYTFLTLYLVKVIYSDSKYRIIHNQDVLTLAFLNLILCSVSTNYLGMIAGFVILLLGLVLFFFDIFGAGDIKLISVLSLSIHPKLWFFTLFLIVLLGGVVAAWMIIIALVTGERKIIHHGVPYSIAIIPPAWFSIGLTLLIHF
ncbi:prepilin peptidase [Vibrio cincinnatiensis]|uniref:prepilin peptidase n=1 Tax=Vibrio cincinnatiensis TaxID=675 RepID=UPI001EDF4A30|nr:prepilin peptidase [Vibrio cincinnatiensis]